MKALSLFGANAQLSAITRRYLWTACVISVLAILIGLLDGAGVTLLVPLLSTFSDGLGATSAGALGFIERFAQGHAKSQRLLIVTSVILSCMLLRFALQALSNVFAGWTDGRVGDDIRCALAKGLAGLPYSFFLVHSPERLINILSSDSWQTSDAIRVILNQIGAAVAVCVFAFMLLLISWKLSLFVFAGGFVARLLQRRVETKLRILSTHMVSINQQLAQRMLLIVFGARLIRLFHTQVEEENRFAQTSDDLRRANLTSERHSGTLGPMLEGIHGVLLVAVLLVATFSGVGLPVLAAFLVLMNRIQPHLRILEQSGAAFASASGHFREVEWLLSMHDRVEKPSGNTPFAGLGQTIEFDHVTFDYGERGAPALLDASFTIHKGRATAIMGESGAGKSTLINLFCRLLDPTAGEIRVDGVPLSSIKVDGWLDALAIAGQDIDLIDGTIAENILYGRFGTSRSAVQAAAKAAHADFIDALPLGLETLVGPRGLSLSGGQRQRIGIARALARKPDVLIFDEATNAIDQETEFAVFKSLQELRGEMTILVISHRPSTIAFCDDAIVLERSRVVHQGPLCMVNPEIAASMNLGSATH